MSLCFGMASKIIRHRDLGFFFQGYIKSKIGDVPLPQQPVAIRQLSVTTVSECGAMPENLI